MRFLIMVKATRDSEAGVMPEEKLMGEMATVPRGAGEGGRAPRRLRPPADLEGLAHQVLRREAHPHRRALRGDEGVLAGYTLIKVKSREEAIEWTKRFPNPAGEGKDAEIEVRQLFELEDFAPSEAADRFRDMGLDTKK